MSDVTATTGGTIVAGVSVASSAMQQILCRYYLKKHSVSSHELLSATAPLQVRASCADCSRTCHCIAHQQAA